MSKYEKLDNIFVLNIERRADVPSDNLTKPAHQTNKT